MIQKNLHVLARIISLTSVTQYTKEWEALIRRNRELRLKLNDSLQRDLRRS
jgi:hypothetical protein